MATHVLSHRDNGLLLVTLNRPEKANALSGAMLECLCSIFAEAKDDTGLRALVLSGAGEKVFCAGADLSEQETVADNEIWDRMAEALNGLKILTVAAINGPCVGGGMTLALGCDLRLAVPSTHFAYPVLRNGVLPGARDAERLQALIGPGRTSMLLLGGARVTAEEARAWGLVDRLVERSELEAAVSELCSAALTADGEHLAAMKRLCRGGKP